MSKRIASFAATYTTSVEIAGAGKEFEETYRVKVGNNTNIVGIYNWDFTYINADFHTVVDEISQSTITKIEVMFKYNKNEDGIKISFLEYEGPDPKFTDGTSILAAIQTTELATADILSTNKTALTTELDDVDFFYYESLLHIANRESITVGIQRHTDLLTSSGELEVSGQSLVAGTSEWRSASPTEPVDAPLLIITYNVAIEAHPELNMKFTTSDPTTSQSTPSNSLGKYIAINDVAPSSPIDESISSIQTTIPIDPDSALPTKLGLGSVGPEIFQYSIIDTTNHQLSSVARGIAPNAFPAGFDSFKNAEKVHFLAKDATNDLHLLFDTRPASELVQYRCIAIANVDTGDDFNITDGVIGIAQNPDAKSQIIIGVELPQWDAISGIAVDGTNNTGNALLVTNDATIIAKADEYYDGALLKITDLAGVVSYTVADSFATDGSTGEFIISPTITGLIASWSFVLMPAPAQQISNDAAAPNSISGRFGGFSEDVEGISVKLLDHGVTMQENDLFYVWLKRTLTANTESESDTGAVLIFRYRDV